MKERRIRLSDIAKEAGVSTMAVSHVLNGSGRGKVSVSPPLSAHIRKVAQSMKYRPHQAARALRGSSIKVIGAISYGSLDPIKTRAIACLHTTVERHGFHLMSSRITESSPNWHDSIVALLSHGVNALLAFCGDDDHAEIAVQLGKEEGVRVIPVRLDGGLLDYPGYGIRTDLQSGIELGLAQFSRDKPVHIVSNPTDSYWSGSQIKQLENLNFDLVETMKLSKGDQILTSSDWEAAKLIQQNDHLTPGLDYKIIGWGNAPACEYMNPQLSSIGLNLVEVVDAAVGSIIANKEPSLHHIKPIFIKRHTHS